MTWSENPFCWPTWIWDDEISTLAWTLASPMDPRVKASWSARRTTTFPISSSVVEFSTSSTSHTTGAQNDISTFATAAYFSGSTVILIAFGIRQNKALASLPEVAFRRENITRIVLAIGTKFESMNTWVSALELSLMYTMSFTIIDSKNCAEAGKVRVGLTLTSELSPKREYRSNCSSEGAGSFGQWNAEYNEVLTWGLLAIKRGLFTGRYEMRWIEELAIK